MHIEVRHIDKTFGDFAALRDVSLQIPDGELVALLGPSGSGKTTLLRIIAGLDLPDTAPNSAVMFHGKNVLDQPAGKRQVGFVFQHYALFRQMSVFENVAFGLRVRPRRLRPRRAEIARKVHDLLKLVHLDALADRLPSQLSGGQRQRVALARALAVEPEVLLLDEPFGSLDAKVRLELRAWLRRLHDEIGMTSIFVTHDQEEALEVADRVVVMNQGRIEQIGTPDEIFNTPRTEFVAAFIGTVNFFHARVDGGKLRVDSLRLEYPADGGSRNGDARVFVRPHDLELSHKPNGKPAFRATVARVNSAGPVVRVELVSETGQDVRAELSQDRFRGLQIARGKPVYVTPTDMKVFAENPMDFAI